MSDNMKEKLVTGGPSDGAVYAEPVPPGFAAPPGYGQEYQQQYQQPQQQYQQYQQPPGGYAPPPGGYAPPPGGYAPPPGNYYPPQQQQQGGQPNIIISNNQQMGGGGGGEYIPDYCFLSWFACLCCCPLIGILAIIQSSNVQNRLAAGDYAGARANSNTARQLGLCGIFFGVIATGVLIALAASGVFVVYYYYPYYR